MTKTRWGEKQRTWGIQLKHATTGSRNVRRTLEALAIYVLFKDLLHNAPVHVIFEQWRKRGGKFAALTVFGKRSQLAIVNALAEE